ncbi:MAG: hypothetical protein AAF903_01290 [Pseudomonadota bacterium]
MPAVSLTSPAAAPTLPTTYPFAPGSVPAFKKGGMQEGTVEFVQSPARENAAWAALEAEKQAQEDLFAAGDAVPLARVVRSVVAEAGLNRFVYLNGASGKRYVFSSIQPEQAGLYDRALFAATAVGGTVLRVSDRADEVIVPGTLLHVHLLDDDGRDDGFALKDLNLTLAS